MNQQPHIANAEVLTLRCTQCGASAKPGCNCGVRYEYISPSKLAERAIKNDPNKSDRAIAAELGVGFGTVNRARKRSDPNGSVETRTGRDGKKRRVNGTARKPRTPVLDKARTIVRPLVEADEKINAVKLQKEHGISHVQIEAAVAAERAREEVFAELLDAAAAKNFTDKGKVTIENAIRIHKAQLERQFQQRVNDGIRQGIADADNAARDENKRLRQENVNLNRIVGQRGVFSKTQFRQMQMLCHPDNSASEKLRAELSQVLVDNEIKLIKAS